MLSPGTEKIVENDPDAPARHARRGGEDHLRAVHGDVVLRERRRNPHQRRPARVSDGRPRAHDQGQGRHSSARALSPNCICTPISASMASTPRWWPPSRAATRSRRSPRSIRSRRLIATIATLLADPAIDVVDICTPPALHAQMIVEAVRAGKHVICEKPFTGYFGRAGDPAPIGKKVPKAAMYEHVMAEMSRAARGDREQRQAIHVCRRLGLCAGAGEDRRNPQRHRGQDPVHESRGEPQRLARRARGAVVDDRRRLADPHGMSPVGGGALSQAGRSPRARRNHRRARRDRRRRQCRGLPSAAETRAFIKANPVDVEDWGMMTVTFTDGTKGDVLSGDMIMGGVRNLIETYTNSGSLFANITPNNQMMTYHDRREKLGRRLLHREGGPQDRLAIRLPRRGMDARLPAGDPGFHGMRRDRPAAAGRSGPRLRNHTHPIRRLLGGGGRPAHRAMTRRRLGRVAHAG